MARKNDPIFNEVISNCERQRVMVARVPDLPKGSDIRRFGEVVTQIDLASEQHVQKPAIAAPCLLRLSTGIARPTQPRG
jgi:hypothetical protein